MNDIGRWHSRVVLIFLVSMMCWSIAWARDASHMDMTWRGEELAEVVGVLSEHIHESILVGDRVRGSVYMKLKHVTTEQALHHILSMYGLVKWTEQGVTRIEPISVWTEHVQQQQRIQRQLLEQTHRVQKKWTLHYAEVKAIAKLIQAENASLLSSIGSMRMDERLNTLWVSDVPDRIRQIDQLVRASDIPLQQVMVTVRIASVDQGVESELGLKWGQGKKGEETAKSGEFWLSRVLDGRLLDFKLSLLEKHGVLELISSPQLFTLDHQTASIETGEEMPYQELSQGGGTAVAFKKAVLSLKVTPQILPEQRVLLKLSINQDKPSSRIVQGVPSIQTRQIETSVMLKNNQTIALGGIYELGYEQSREGIPFFRHILGQFTTRNQKRQLLVFVTPTVVGE